MKTKKIPKGLVVLETIFDNHDRFKKNEKEHDAKELEEVNLLTTKSPKKVYIGNKLSLLIRKILIELLRK